MLIGEINARSKAVLTRTANLISAHSCHITTDEYNEPCEIQIRASPNAARVTEPQHPFSNEFEYRYLGAVL